MKDGIGGLAGRAAAMAAAGSGGALSLWWCFWGPSEGLGLWVPLIAGGMLGAAMKGFSGNRGRKWKRVRAAEIAGMAASGEDAGAGKTACRNLAWLNLGRTALGGSAG